MLASGSTGSRCGASSRRIDSRTPRSITPVTTTAPSRSRHATTFAGESLAATTGIDGIDKSSAMVSVQQREAPASCNISYQLAGVGDTGRDHRRRSTLLQSSDHLAQMRSDGVGRYLTGGEPPRRSKAHQVEHEDRKRQSRSDHDQRHY